MKRNSIFMLAYIAFVAICFIVRIFWNYPMWDNIVLAITISSVFFAYADMFHIIADSIERGKRLSLEQCNHMMGIVDDTMNHLRKLKANTDDDREKELLNESIDSYSEMRNKLNQVRKKYVNLKIVNVCRNVENASLFIAFLFLLCALVFQSLTKKLISVQSYATVLAFLLILLTPVIGTWIKGKSNKEINEGKDIETAFSVLEKVYRKELEHHAD